ncbi:hypothetical protein [Aeromonas enteropelogenes]|uniref:hypothetical protein n=1 Tax=Aeromonas enteropelogenes TaxID=29489 RepID=UPI003B9E89F3
MNEPDEIFAAKYILGIIGPKDIVEFADRKLTEGSYSDIYIDILDSEYKTMPDLAPMLEAVWKQPGIIIPDINQAAWTMLRYHLRKIADGTVNPREEFSELLQDIEVFDLTNNITKYVGDNVGIELMYGWYYEDYATDQEINAALKKEAANWIERYGSKH